MAKEIKSKVLEINDKKIKLYITEGMIEEFDTTKKIKADKIKKGEIIKWEKKGKYFSYLGRSDSINQDNIKEDYKTKQYPYNFVSLGENVINRGKIELGVNSGKLSCSLENLTPLFIMGESNQLDFQNSHTEEKFYREDDIPVIPGSTLKGVIRNIIDTLTNSVIRNVSSEPLNQRKKATSNKKEKYKAVFGIIQSLPDEEKDGEIIEANRIRVALTKNNGKEYLKNYDKNGLIEKIDLKKEIYNISEIKNPFEYRKLISDDSNSVKGVFWISSYISRKIHEKILIPKINGKIYKFSKKEYEDFKDIIRQRAERINNGKEKGVDKFYYSEQELEIGDPVLFETINDKAEHLAFSEIPRLRYKYSPLDLVPKEFLPTDSFDKLSFSEKVFGTTGDNAKKDKQEKKNIRNKKMGISGRVFFSDAKNYNSKMIDNGKLITLKAFGEPHPTLTTFYLNNTDKDYNDKEGVYIRGRKFYWHHKDKINKEFSDYRKSLEMPKNEKGENEFAYNSSIELMDINNKFEFEVYFKNLTDEELGILIYALELEEGLLHKVGKGKAFGFGSCKIRINEFLLESNSKYSSFSENIFSEGDKLYYVKVAREKYIDEKRNNIKELKAILSKDNDLNFTKSPFPEERKKDKNGIEIGEKNTLNWFINNKKGNRKIILKGILDKND